ncbi:hypothetical protein SAMN05443575_4048 [Jatrophihabitans endophyticus]|uniref:Uncharacterized protein n=2 Tax=Jatrophihabitans endophyticus TaxID=1206085 RepID=A0A1M5TVB4_9ACTN|nr:hypothetical protein SAMN05443575_4048 [Jatrophihabitans endophyticus]
MARWAQTSPTRCSRPWPGSGTAETLLRLQRFYDALAGADHGLRTPRIREVLVADDRVVSVEDRLAGRPLRAGMDDREHVLREADVEAVTTVLAGLARVTPDVVTPDLPLLPGEPALPHGAAFGTALADVRDGLGM